MHLYPKMSRGVMVVLPFPRKGIRESVVRWTADEHDFFHSPRKLDNNPFSHYHSHTTLSITNPSM